MKYPWMPLHVGDYLSDTGHLTTVQHGAYLLLIMHYWRTGSLPGDAKQMASIARMRIEDWRRIEPVIKAFFHDGWHHKRVSEELSLAGERQRRRAEAGRLGGIEKARKNSSNATAMPKQCSSNLQPTTNKEEEGKKETRAKRALRSDWPADYREQFWSQYPHKVGKPKALGKLDRLSCLPDSPSFADLMAGLLRYSAKNDFREWLNPATWLNQARWADQPAAVNNGGNFNGHKQHASERAFELADQLERSLESAIKPAGGSSGDRADVIGLLEWRRSS